MQCSGRCGDQDSGDFYDILEVFSVGFCERHVWRLWSLSYFVDI
jgi:hypothetical protein